MTEQIVVTLDDASDLSKDAWKDFVRSRRGKWRGVASEEAETALLEYMEKCEGGSEAENGDLERLSRENERLSRENERLREEIERLRERLEDGGSPSPSPAESTAQETNNAEQLTKIASSSESAKQSAATAEDDESESWWDGYDADAYDVIDLDSENPDVIVPEEAVRELEDVPVEDVPGVRLAHVQPESTPYKYKEAKRRLIVAALRGEGYRGASAGIVKEVADAVLGDDKGDTPDDYHVRSEYVRPVMGMLPDHPSDDAKVCTSEAVRAEIAEEVEDQKREFVEAVREKHVGLAVLAGQYLDESRAGLLRETGYRDEWQEVKEDVVGEEFGEEAWEVVEQALFEVYDAPEPRFRRNAWEELWAEWPPTARGLVDWWAERDRTPDVDAARRGEIAEQLAPYVPDVRESFDGEQVEG